MTKFDPTVPESESRVQSEPIRNNFLALNERTNQLTPSATSPVSTNVTIGVGDKVTFENNIFAPFSGANLDLGDATSGVSSFVSPNTFKEIIVYYVLTDSEGNGELGFIESAEKSIRDHSTETAKELINDISAQRVPDETTGESTEVPNLAQDISPLDDAILICSVLVTNNGQTGEQGAISTIFDTDIIDIRPFMQRTFSTKGVESVVDDAVADLKITNSQVQKGGNTAVTANVVSSNSVPVDNSAPFDPSSLGYNPVVRFTADTPVEFSSSFVTARVTSVTATNLILDRNVTVNLDDQVILGQFTADKMIFDLAESVNGEDITPNSVTASGGFIGDLTGTASDLSGNITASQVSDFDSAVTSSTHAGRTDNPHSVTIDQVDGYSTSEIDGYLAAKADLSHTHDASTDLTNQVPIANGGTGASTEAGARTNLQIYSGTINGVNSVGQIGSGTLSFNPNDYNIVVSWSTESYNSDRRAVDITQKDADEFYVRSSAGTAGAVAWIAIKS